MRLSDRILSSSWRGFVVVALAIILAGCGTAAPPPPAKDAQAQAQPSEPGALTDPLRISDRVKIEITGTPEPLEASDQEINGDGTINVHLIGFIHAAGKTPIEVEKEIQSKLVPSFYAHANVTVTPSGRYFYVGGEVGQGSSGGRYIYSGPITVTRAIDAAGGFNPFANRRKVRLTRVDGTSIIVNCRKAIQDPTEDKPVFPGDRIYVPRRF